MRSRPVQRHDAFFQALLDRPGTAGTLLRERLPPAVAALLAAEPPELVPGSFVSRRLRGYRTDRLYRTRTLTGRPALIYTLIEHKSAPSRPIVRNRIGNLCHRARLTRNEHGGDAMPTRNVVLTEHQDALIEALVASGRYQNASEVLRDGLRLIERRDAEEAAKLDALRQAAQSGIAAIGRGDSVAFAAMDDLMAHLDAVAETAIAKATGQ